MATLGMFEQGFYDRVGFGSGPYLHEVVVDPGTLAVGHVPYRQPLRLSTPRLRRVPPAPPATPPAPWWRHHRTARSDARRAPLARQAAVRPRLSQRGRSTHPRVPRDPRTANTGPYHVRYLAYEQADQLLELLRLLRELSDQVHSVKLIEPAGVQLQDLINAPLSHNRKTSSVGPRHRYPCPRRVPVPDPGPPGLRASSQVVRIGRRLQPAPHRPSQRRRTPGRPCQPELGRARRQLRAPDRRDLHHHRRPRLGPPHPDRLDRRVLAVLARSSPGIESRTDRRPRRAPFLAGRTRRGARPPPAPPRLGLLTRGKRTTGRARPSTSIRTAGPAATFVRGAGRPERASRPKGATTWQASSNCTKTRPGSSGSALKAGNGEIIAVGEAYESKASARKGIESVMRKRRRRPDRRSDRADGPGRRCGRPGAHRAGPRPDAIDAALGPSRSLAAGQPKCGPRCSWAPERVHHGRGAPRRLPDGDRRLGGSDGGRVQPARRGRRPPPSSRKRTSCEASPTVTST